MVTSDCGAVREAGRTPATIADIAVGKVALWTLPWFAVIVGALLVGSFTKRTISYEDYVWFRRAAGVLLVLLAVAGLLFSLNIVGKDKARPWYCNSFLVALVLFWGLCPPAFFFTEYFLVDQGTLLPPVDLATKIANAKAGGDVAGAQKLASDHLGSVKTYADLASKIWVSVGAALATAIGLAKK